MPWYQEPSWWALLVSLTALCVSVSSMWHGRRATRSTIQRSLIDHALEVNNTILRYKIKGPFAFHLDIPDDQVEDFSAKAALLLQQVNLLREVYENQGILGERAVSSHLTWMTTMLRPWIHDDDHLREAWKLTRESRDLFEPKFIKWLESHLEFN